MTKAVKTTRKKGRRLKKSIRKTLGTLLLISAIIVAAIPVDGLQARSQGPDNWGTLRENFPSLAVNNQIPEIAVNDMIYTTGDGRFQFAFQSGSESTKGAIILGYAGGALSGGALEIPNVIDCAYLQRSKNEGTNADYVAVGEKGSFLYYRIEILKQKMENGELVYDDKNNPVMEHDKWQYKPCSNKTESEWIDIEPRDLYCSVNYPQSVPLDSDTEDANYAPAGDSGNLRIRDIEVWYIGNQYLKDNTDPDSQSKWVIDGTVNYATRTMGVFAQNGTNITTLKVGASMRGIGDYAFYGCSNLNGIELNDGLRVIGVGAFADCINMSSAKVALNSSINVIADYAFYNCMALENFTVPINVWELGDSVFEGCTGMTRIDLTGNNSNVALRHIGDNVFRNCASLKSITFPSMATFEQIIDVSTFDGCVSLEYIEAAQIYNKVDFTGDFAKFKATVPTTFYFKGLKNSPVHQTATRNEIAYSFYDEGSGKYVYELTKTEADGKAVFWVDDAGNLVYCKMDDGKSTVTIPSIIGPNPVIAIGSGTFQNNCFLKLITIPESIESISDGAFRGCHNLKDVIFENPEKMTAIGVGAFKTQDIAKSHGSNCPADPSYVSGGNANQGSWTPVHDPVLNFVGPISNDSEPFKYAMDREENINAGDQARTYITYHSGWPTNLVVRYNYDRDKNELVDYPTLKKMQEGEYSSSKYAYITPAYQAAAREVARKYLSGESLTEDEEDIIGAALDIVLPDGIEAIGRVTDGNGNEAGLFEYKEEKEEFGSDAVSNVTIRKKITAEGLINVEENAFKGCKYLGEIVLSDKTVEIGDHAFEDCKVLTKVSIPATVTKIGLSPFRGCDSLENSYEVDKDGNEIIKVNFNKNPKFSCGENSIIYEMSDGKPVKLLEYLNGKKPSIVTSQDVEGIKEIAPEAFMNTKVTSVDLSGISEAKIGIPENTFRKTPNLYSVVLPDGCVSISKDAFSDSGIQLLTIPNASVVIHPDAFNDTDHGNLTFECVKGSTAEIYADEYGIHHTPILPVFTVTFYNEELDVVDTQNVKQGGTVTPPTDLEDLPPTKGYTRLTWTPPAGTIVTADTKVYAKYEPMSPDEFQKVVNFYAYDKETILSTQTVTPGEEAVPPVPPNVEGYAFTAWWPEDMKITDETENPYNIYAQYEKIDSSDGKHTVRFISYDKSVLLTLRVEDGKDVTIPASLAQAAAREGYTFTGWKPLPLNVTEDMDVYAQYSGSGSDGTEHTVRFIDYDGTVLTTLQVEDGKDAVIPASLTQAVQNSRPGLTFTGWKPLPLNVRADMDVVAQYSAGNNSSGSSNTGSSNTTANSTPHTLTVRNGSGSGSYRKGEQVIVVANNPPSGQEFSGWTVSPANTVVTDKTLSAIVLDMPDHDVALVANYKTKSGSGSSGNTGTGNTSSNRPDGSTNTKPSGGTTVVIDKNGLSNTGVVSATITGSSDNFTIKISESSAASESILNALMAEFGSLDNIKYFPMDISLYDSTGTKKITDTTGLKISITLPLPDSLIEYAGNNKVAGVVNDKLDKLSARFTTISGVPCITFSAEHFSPYVIYVDLGNMSAGNTVDTTPKTGDTIHPKWFLSIGLACLSFILFMQKDSGSRKKKAKAKVRV